MIKEILQDITRYFDLLIEEGYYVAFHNLSIPLQNYMGVLAVRQHPFGLHQKIIPGSKHNR